MISVSPGRKEEQGRHHPCARIFLFVGTALRVYSPDTDITLSQERWLL